jgi:hypothetical protein
MILAAGLMLTLSTTKGNQEQQGGNSGGRGQWPAERWCWRGSGSPVPTVMMMMAIRGTVAGGAAVITSVRCQIRVWRFPFADALPGRM